MKSQQALRRYRNDPSAGSRSTGSDVESPQHRPLEPSTAAHQQQQKTSIINRRKKRKRRGGAEGICEISVPVAMTATALVVAAVVAVAWWIAFGSKPDAAASSSAKTVSSMILEGQRQQQQSQPPYAYAFLLADCDLDEPKYRLFLYSVYVSITLLRQYGSKADIIVYYGMRNESKYNDIPRHELDVLRNQLNVTLKKLPKSVSQSFYTIQLNKFRVLGLTQYKRILYMDADVLPLANLDFFFHMSDPESPHHRRSHDSGDSQDNGMMMEQMAYRTYLAPMNGGFFMITPKKGDVERIQSMISKKEMSMNHGNQFDVKMGWGHRVPSWTATQREGTGWTWWGANGDQGLIYYWFKHVKRSYSLVLPNGHVENYKPSPHDPTDVILKDVIQLDESKKQNNIIHHFTGTQKPWYQGCPEHQPSATGRTTHVQLWCSTLVDIIRRYDLGIELSDVKTQLKHYTTADVRQQRGLVTNLLDEETENGDDGGEDDDGSDSSDT